MTELRLPDLDGDSSLVALSTGEVEYSAMADAMLLTTVLFATF